ncbi:MAG TPA: hypothetical protein VL053_07660 [Arachidicoccus sp.]|nr:hypothetical protein [Arachidicoccus sp.]
MKKSETPNKKPKQSTKDKPKEIAKYKMDEKAHDANLNIKNSGPMAPKQFKKKM